MIISSRSLSLFSTPPPSLQSEPVIHLETSGLTIFDSHDDAGINQQSAFLHIFMSGNDDITVVIIIPETHTRSISVQIKRGRYMPAPDAHPFVGFFFFFRYNVKRKKLTHELKTLTDIRIIKQKSSAPNLKVNKTKILLLFYKKKN